MRIQLSMTACASLAALIIFCATGVSQPQSIVSDVQDQSTMRQLDRLKKMDAQELYGHEQSSRLKRYPLVIFIPGILGSKIDECDKRNDQLVNCTPIWGQKGWDSSVDMSIKSTKQYRTTVLDNFKALGREVDFYGEGLAYIHSMHVSDHDTLIAFSYDWRQDNRLSALSLQEFLCALPDAQKARPIIFVAHSMGGLILKYWLGRIHPKPECPGGSMLNINVREIMFVGTPHFGAPQSMKAFAEGFNLDEEGGGVFGILKNFYTRNTVAAELNRHGPMFPSVYQLLPIYDNSCVAEQRRRFDLPKTIATNTAGIFELFSAKAWREVRWPKTLPSGVTEAAFYDRQLPKFLKEAEQFLCFVAKVEFPAGMRVAYFSSGSHNTVRNVVLKRIPFGNAHATPRVTVGFDKTETAKGDGTVLYDIAINAPDIDGNRHRLSPGEKHEYLLNSREFKERVNFIYHAAQAEVGEELLSDPKRREQLKKVYLDSGLNVFAALPEVTDGVSASAMEMSIDEARARFPNVVEFNRLLADQRGIALADIGKSTAAQNVGARSIVLALQSLGADRYPEKPIRIVVATPPGSGADLAARIFAQKLTARLGQDVLVENVGGAGGNIGTGRVARAAPDGYTLLMSANAPITINANLYTGLNFDPVRDLAPVSLVATVPSILAVQSALPVRSIAELVAFANAQPGTVTFGSAGIGSTQHFTGELFKKRAHVQIAHVPYRGSAPALNDLISGHVSMTFASPAQVGHLLRDGRLRALAVTSDKRLPTFPDLPTVAESGLPGFEASSWLGLLAPAGTPSAIIRKLNLEAARILADPEVRAKLNELGIEPAGNSPHEFEAIIQAEVPKWAEVAREAAMSPN